MARLYDSDGALLGGLEISLARLLVSLNEAPPVAVPVPASPPPAPTYELGEAVFALHCAYGSFPSLVYSTAPQAAGGCGHPPWRHRCNTFIEEPEERHFCPACGGYYCLAHAEAASHRCRSIRRFR